MKRNMHPVQDKAQVTIDFPEKFYMGSFLHDSKFEARAENDGIFIKLLREGEDKRRVEMHIHHHLLADILSEWADSLADEPPMEKNHRDTLLKSLAQVQKALRAAKSK